MIEETDAGANLVQSLNQLYPVRAAFWVKDSDEGQWYLYIASDQINDSNQRGAYADLLCLAGEMATPYLDPFQVKLISTSDPLVQAAIQIHRPFPGPMPTRLGGNNFGGIGVDGAFIYPFSEYAIGRNTSCGGFPRFASGQGWSAVVAWNAGIRRD